MKQKSLLCKALATIVALSFVLASVCVTFSASSDELSLATSTVSNEGSFTLVDSPSVQVKNGLVVNIPAGAKAYYVLDSFKESCYIKDFAGQPISKNAILATGYTLINVATNETMAIVVDGDVNGDTRVNGVDIIRAKKYMLQTSGGYSCYVEAIDMNRDGSYTQEDIDMLFTAVAEGPCEMPDTEIVDVPLEEREPLNIGTDFYASIDLMYTQNSLMPQYSSTNSVVAYSSNASAEQTWHFTRNSDGTYTIKNLAYGKVLDLSGAAVSGMDVKVYAESGSEAQKWNIVDSGDGVHYILYPEGSTNAVLDVAAASTADNANIALYEFNDSFAQKFLISRIDIDTTASYFDMVAPSDLGDVFYSTISAGGSKRISNRYSELYLYNTKNQPGEMWKFERQADGSYSITNMAKPGKALDISGAVAENLTPVQLYDSNKTKAQLWNLYIKDGSVVFSSALSKNFVLDIYSGSFTHGQKVDIYTFNDTAAQKFTLENKTDDYSPVLPKNKHYDILFIGNSFTWYHQMSIYRFANICSAGGYDVSVTLIEHGGAKLSQYCPGGSYYSEVAAQLDTGKFEYVVLQEQSTTPLTDPSGFHSAVKTLTSLVRSKGGEVVLYQTWGFHPSHGTTQSYGSVGAMELALRNSYDAIGYDVGAIMANVGKAFTTVYNANGLNINLWLAADLYHPSELGSTLAAYTIFASIFRADPRVGIDHTFGSDASKVAVLKEAAYTVTFQ